MASDLALNQPLRKIEDPEQWQQLEEFIGRIHKCLEQGDFTLRIRDPSGNSYLKNPFAPKMDPALKVVGFVRSREELEQMGYSVENAEEEQKHLAHRIDFTAPFDERRLLREDGVQFEVNCHSCGLSGNLRMCETNIPFFKDLLIMAFTCEYCGAHSTETKTSGEVPPFARKITLSVSLATAQADLRRDLFKSDTCGVRIPELDLELTYGTLGGVYTTVEGLLEKIYEHLSGICSFTDSDEDYAARMKQLLSDLAALREGCKEFVLELDDPLGFSFLQNPCHPDKDPNTLVESY